MCLGADKKMAVLQAFNFSLATMATVLICFVTLLAYSLIPGNPPLVPSTVRPPPQTFRLTAARLACGLSGLVAPVVLV